jgi:hypothetical protein
VSVGGLSNEPANNLQSSRVNPPKSRNSFSFAGPFAGYCKAFYDKCVDQPANDLQTTCKLLIYERENKPCFSLELSHIQFINYKVVRGS